MLQKFHDHKTWFIAYRNSKTIIESIRDKLVKINFWKYEKNRSPDIFFPKSILTDYNRPNIEQYIVDILKYERNMKNTSEIWKIWAKYEK